MFINLDYQSFYSSPKDMAFKLVFVAVFVVLVSSVALATNRRGIQSYLHKQAADLVLNDEGGIADFVAIKDFVMLFP